MYRLGWFSTGRDSAARDLLGVVRTAIEQGEIAAEMDFVFCSREPGESEESDLFLRLVEGYRLPLVTLSYQRFRASQATADREELRLAYDREVMKRLEPFHPDLCVLAGYMLIVGGELCRRYKMVNLHPAAPGGPTGTWQEVIWQLMETGAGETGVMMHLVTPELDRGPVVAYCTFPIRGEPFDEYWREIAGQSLNVIKEGQGEDNPLFRLIRGYGLAREFPLIVATIRAFSEGRVRVTPDGTVVDAAGMPIKGYNLTEEINEQVRG